MSVAEMFGEPAQDGGHRLGVAAVEGLGVERVDQLLGFRKGLASG